MERAILRLVSEFSRAAPALPHRYRSNYSARDEYDGIEYGGLPVNYCMSQQMNRRLCAFRPCAVVGVLLWRKGFGPPASRCLPVASMWPALCDGTHDDSLTWDLDLMLQRISNRLSRRSVSIRQSA
jgi:hypothetical protein